MFPNEELIRNLASEHRKDLLREAEMERMLKEYRVGKGIKPFDARALIPAGVMLTVVAWVVTSITS